MPATETSIVVGSVPKLAKVYIERPLLAHLYPSDRSASSSAMTFDGIRRLPPIALLGHHGVGKTQLAAHYARRCIRDGWTLVAWIDASTPQLMLSGLAALALAVGIYHPLEEPSAALKRLKSYLMNRETIGLIVFDNAVDPTLLREHIPAAGAIQVLVTSNDRAVSGIGRVIPVSGFSREESISFLTASTAINVDAGADDLAAALGDLPMALEQAAATMRIRRLTHKEYLNALIAECDQTLNTRDTPIPVASSVSLTVQTLHERDQTGVTARLLEIVSILAYESVPRELLLSVAAPTKIDKVLRDCARASVLFESADGFAFGMHPLIATAVRHGRYSKDDVGTTINAALTVLQKFVGKIEDGGEEVHRLTPHIEALWLNISSEKPDIALVRKALGLRIWAVWHLIRVGTSDTAIELGRRVLDDHLRALGPDEPQTLQFKVFLGQVYFESGRVDEGILLLEGAVDELKQLLAVDDPETLAAQFALARGYLAMGRSASAAELLAVTLMGQVRALGRNHLDTLSTSHMLAIVYAATNNFDDAIPLMMDTLSARSEVFGRDHEATRETATDLAEMLGSRSDTLDSTGEYLQALEAASEAVNLLREWLPAVATKDVVSQYIAAFIRLALLQARVGKLENALHTARQAADFRNLWRTEHTDDSSMLLPTNLVRALGQGALTLVAGPETPILGNALGRKALVIQLLHRFQHQTLSAETIEALSERVAAGHLDEAVSALRSAGAPIEDFVKALYRPSPGSLYSMLARLQFTSVVSMNWDKALLEAFENRNPVVLRPQGNGVLRAAKSRRFSFTWITGSPDGEQVAVGSREMHLQLEEDEVLRRFLSGVVQSTSLVFLGASVGDIESFFTALQLPNVVNSGSGPIGSRQQHFAFVERDQLWDVRRSEALSYGVHLIGYGPARIKQELSEHVVNMWLATQYKNAAHVLSDVQPKLSRVRLTNIGPYEHVDLQLNGRWNLLLGNNGCGKSTLLRAIALGLCGDHPRAAEAGERLLRLGSNVGSIELTVGTQRFRTDLLRSSDAVQVRTSSLTPLQQGNVLVLGFPALRGISAVSPTGLSPAQVREPSVEDLLPLLFNEPDRRLDDIRQWIVNMDARDRRQQNATGARLIDTIFRVIADLTPGFEITSPIVDQESFEVFVTTEDGVLPVEQLSQGISSVLTWVGTLLERLFDVFKASPDPLARAAVVLVDEIDVHLHPAWQRALPRLVSKHFPNVQFIASSHSPLIAGGLNAGELFVARRELTRMDDSVVSVAFVEPSAEDPAGMRADQILTTPLFGMMTSRSINTEKEIDRVSVLIGMAHRTTQEEQELGVLREQLSTQLHSGETAFERASEGAATRRVDELLRGLRSLSDEQKSHLVVPISDASKTKDL